MQFIRPAVNGPYRLLFTVYLLAQLKQNYYKMYAFIGILFISLYQVQTNNSPIQMASFEKIYDTYAAMLYGIALKISPGKKEAEEILIRTFRKIQQQKLLQQKHPSLCIALVKLTIQTAYEQPNQKNTLISKQFENTALLNKLLFQNTTIETLCEQSLLTRDQVTKKIREEILALRNMKKENNFPFKAAIGQ